MRRRAPRNKPAGGRRQSAKARAADSRPRGMWQAGNQAIAQAIAQAEQSFGQDLSGVEVHADAQGRKAADALGANAVARGEQIFLGSGAPPVQSEPGQRLLAHELAHVVQQRKAGKVNRGEVGAPGSALEHGADRAAGLAMRGQAAQISPAASAPGVQRQTPGKETDMDELLRAMKAQTQKGIVPGPDLDIDEKIKKRPAGPLLPKRQKAVMDWLGAGREDKDPNARLKPAKPSGMRDVGAEADEAIGTKLLPQLPVHLLINKLTGGDKPKPRPQPAQQAEDKPADAGQKEQKAADRPAAGAAQQDKKPAQASGAQPASVDLKGPVAAAFAAAQQKGAGTAEVRLDAGLKVQAEAVLGQLQTLVEAQAQGSKITSVKVYFGNELVKTIAVGGKK